MSDEFLVSFSVQAWSEAVLAWYHRHGRKTLPWQQQPTPYRVWVSEIMLQQTQVATVVDYYLRFMQRFPRLEDLAAASQDEVLHLWTGLGYYSRARNLHKTAGLLVHEYQGEWPDTVEALMALPGIGRSTAGAILSLSGVAWAGILDGNVKRVLARASRLALWPGAPKAQAQLWAWVEQLTPVNEVRAYNQAMMDLGAMVCTRARPACECCPVQALCQAYQQDEVAEYPKPKPKRIKPTKAAWWLVLQGPSGGFWLEQRPQQGIWGGLWSFPECGSLVEVEHALAAEYQLAPELAQLEPVFVHTFTHYHLQVTPAVCRLEWVPETEFGRSVGVWYDPAQPGAIGLPAPVKKLIEQLSEAVERAD